MTAQQRFMHTLHCVQSFAANPEKMPYLCVIGTQDFDELRAEFNQEQVREYLARIEERVAREWDATNPAHQKFTDFKERIEQEEFCGIQGDGSTPATSPILAEAEAALDHRQLVSLTDYFEFCGCKCFRALSATRGFNFA